MSYLLLLFYLSALLYLIKKVSFFHSLHFGFKITAAVFLLKFLGGLALYFVYYYIYPDRISGDVFKYFDDGNILFSALRQNPADYFRMVTGIGADAPHLIQYYDTCHFWIKEFNYGLLNDNRIVIRFNALIRLISMGNIHIHTLFMSFLSFTGLWGIFKVFEPQFKDKKWGLLLAVFFFPSVWFWTSGLLKEGLLIFAFGMLFYFACRWLRGNITGWLLLGMAVSVAILIFSKFYVLVAALPAFMYLILNRYWKWKFPIAQFLLVHLLLLVVLWFSKPIIGLDFPKIVAQKQHDFINFTNSLTQVGSQIEMKELEPTFWGMVQQTPQALVNSFFRPSVLEIRNPLTALAAIENLLILLLLLGAVFFFQQKNNLPPLFWFSVSYVLILFVLIGLTTPILGALVRYKAPALPFLGIALLYLIDFSKIRTFLRFKRHKASEIRNQYPVTNHIFNGASSHNIFTPFDIDTDDQ